MKELRSLGEGIRETEMRRIEVAKLIKSKTMTTPRELASRFDVCDKTIRNDIKALEDNWGVLFDRRHKGRYEIIDLGRLTPMLNNSRLSAEEVNIIMASLVQCKAFMPVKMRIIERTLMSTLNEREQNLLRSTLRTESNLNTAEDQEVVLYIKKIREAILDEKKLEMRYKAPEKSPKTYKLVPYSLACDFGKYYLIAKTDNGDSLIHFRLDRIKGIKVLNETEKHEPEFNVDQYLKRTWYMYSGPETKVRVKFNDGCYPTVTEKNMADGELIERIAGDYFIYEFTTHGTFGIKIWLLGFAESVEILEPPSLREEFKEHIKNMAERYK